MRRKYNCNKCQLRTLLTVTAIFLLTFGRYVQVQVKGKVIDSKGDALIGVNVIVEGTQQGTVTNSDGEFSLTVPNKNTVIKLSYMSLL